MEVQVYKDKAGEYRWRKVAANGRIVSESGEGYTRYADCLEAAEKFADGETVMPARDPKDEARERTEEASERRTEDELRRQERVDPK